MSQPQQRGDVALSDAADRGQFTATVVANVPLCREHYRLVLKCAEFPPTLPGQFVQVACQSTAPSFVERELDWEAPRPLGDVGLELASRQAFLRRPFSLAGRRNVEGAVELDVIYRVVGVGTAWLEHLKSGENLSIIGPLGNHFEMPGEDQVAVLVGGGVGIPPMLYLAEKLAGRRAVVFCGAISRDLLPLAVTGDAPRPTSDGVEPLYNISEFARHGIPAVVTTDDGSWGFRGRVTQALEAYLDRYFRGLGQRVQVYTCGPEAMMHRVAQIAQKWQIDCQISVERAMACGMGTCQSCCIRVRKPDPAVPPLVGSEWVWRLACTDGPVFRGKDLLW